MIQKSNHRSPFLNPFRSRSLITLLIFGTQCLFLSASSTAARPFQPVADWFDIPDSIELFKVSAVAVDSKGNVYIGHRGDHPILLFDSDGNFIRSQGNTDIPPRRGVVLEPREGENPVLDFRWDPHSPDPSQPMDRKVLVDETLRYLHGMHVDAEDNLWVTDVGRSTVLKYDPNGELETILGDPDNPGPGPRQFNQPTDITLDSRGELYVADGYVNSRVLKFSPSGDWLKSWGKRGNAPGEFNTPHAIAIDEKDILYVSDRANQRIQRFDSEGNFLDEWVDLGLDQPGSGELNDIHWGSDGYLYGGTGRGNKIIALNARGELVEIWGSEPSSPKDITGNISKDPGQFNVIHGLCLDPSGHLYVAEVRGFRVQKFERKLHPGDTN